MKLVITGGAGFIGTNYVHLAVASHPDYEILVLDKLTYSGNRSNLAAFGSRVRLIEGDVCDAALVRDALNSANFVVHFAAESHVTRSEIEPDLFYRTNVIGTQTLLDAAIDARVERFVHISTDEVYGPVRDGVFCKETDKTPGDSQATSAYAKSKSLADDLVQTYRGRLSLNIMRPTNNFGPWQHPEKALPRSITRVIRGDTIPLWGEGDQVRDWLFVKDNARAIDKVLHNGGAGEIYNVAANNAPEIRNRDWAHWLLGRLHDRSPVLEHQVDPRPHHDYRYGVDASKLQALGWSASTSVWDGFERTVTWYLEHEEWWRPLIEAAERIYK